MIKETVEELREQLAHAKGVAEGLTRQTSAPISTTSDPVAEHAAMVAMYESWKRRPAPADYTEKRALALVTHTNDPFGYPLYLGGSAKLLLESQVKAVGAEFCTMRANTASKRWLDAYVQKINGTWEPRGNETLEAYVFRQLQRPIHKFEIFKPLAAAMRATMGMRTDIPGNVHILVDDVLENGSCHVRFIPNPDWDALSVPLTAVYADEGSFDWTPGNREFARILAWAEEEDAKDFAAVRTKFAEQQAARAKARRP